MAGTVYEGRTFEEAVRKGLEALRLTRAEAVITTIEEGKGGFLGIGARPYRVSVARRPGGAIREPAEREGERKGRRGGREARGRSSRDAHGRGARDERPGREESGGRERPARREERAAGAERRARDEGGTREGRAPRAPRAGRSRPEEGPPERAARAPARREAAPPAATSPAPPSAAGEADDQQRKRRRRGRRGGRGRRRGGEPEGAGAAAEPRAAERAPRSAPVAAPAASPAVAAMTTTPYPAPPSVAAPPSAEAAAARAPESQGFAAPDAPEVAEQAAAHHEAAEPGPGRAARAEADGAPAESPEMSGSELVTVSRKLTEEMLRAMGFEPRVEARVDGNRVDVQVEVERDGDLLIGRQGETRQALQHLLNRFLNRGDGSRYHLQLEVNDYWQRREVELEQLARKLAEDAVAQNAEMVTDYLNAQERRIVHVTLRGDGRVRTFSLGSGMVKRVAVAPASFPERSED